FVYSKISRPTFAKEGRMCDSVEFFNQKKPFVEILSVELFNGLVKHPPKFCFGFADHDEKDGSPLHVDPFLPITFHLSHAAVKLGKVFIRKGQFQLDYLRILDNQVCFAFCNAILWHNWYVRQASLQPRLKV